MTGLARYDLMHAAVHEGADERISITFRKIGAKSISKFVGAKAFEGPHGSSGGA